MIRYAETNLKLGINVPESIFRSCNHEGKKQIVSQINHQFYPDDVEQVHAFAQARDLTKRIYDRLNEYLNEDWALHWQRCSPVIDKEKASFACDVSQNNPVEFQVVGLNCSDLRVHATTDGFVVIAMIASM